MLQRLTRPSRCIAILVLGGLALAGCASGPTIFVDTDPEANFSGYRTYGFVTPLSTDGEGYSSILSQYLRTAASRELEARGYRRSDTPDLVVNFNLETKEKIRVSSYGSGPWLGGYYGYRSGYYGVWGGYDTQVTQYTEGTLTVDLVDPKRRQLVWDGTAIGIVREKDRKNFQAAIDYAVGQIFAQYPHRATAAP